MRMQEAKELAASLRRRRARLAYFPHRYAAWLLGRVAGRGTPARALKASRHRRLLDNPLVREVAALSGGGVLTQVALASAEAVCREVYRVDLATWGPSRSAGEQGWYQTSRPGSNLVVLLNFPPQHDAAYHRWLDPGGHYPLVDTLHPHARPPELTLAWARVDLDLAGGEALIEEVQSDWIREAGGLWSWISSMDSPALQDRALRRYFQHRGVAFDGLERYWTRVLARHRTWWAEATLFAALWTLREGLAIRSVYYHTHEGGMRRKRIHCEPPRSIYTQLPRRFGFELTSEPPAFLAEPRNRRSRHRLAADAVQWYRLEL